MLHEIEKCKSLKLVGLREQMSLAQNRTGDLWSRFMPRQSTVKHRADQNFYSVENYSDPAYFKNFDPTRKFEKWAAVKVNAVADLPDDMESLLIPEGEYAVFKYVGKASEAPRFYQYIFGEWLPTSDFELDNREHLSIMGPHYRPDDPKAEESIWIPVKRRGL